jgi:hypothetical protein
MLLITEKQTKILQKALQTKPCQEQIMEIKKNNN